MGGFWAWKCTVGQLERTCTQTGHDMDSSTDPDLYDFLAWRDMTQTVKRSSWEVWIVSLRPGVCHIEPARRNILGNCFKGFRRVLIVSLSSYWMLLLPPRTRPTLSQCQSLAIKRSAANFIWFKNVLPRIWRHQSCESVGLVTVVLAWYSNSGTQIVMIRIQHSSFFSISSKKRPTPIPWMFSWVWKFEGGEVESSLGFHYINTHAFSGLAVARQTLSQF